MSKKHYICTQLRINANTKAQAKLTQNIMPLKTKLNKIFGLLLDKRYNYAKKVNLYKKIVNKNDLVYDIGANRGDRIEVFLSLGAKVIAVEPNPKLADYLRRKYGKKIVVEQKAVGDRNGIVDFFINERSDVLSTVSDKFLKESQKTGRFSELIEAKYIKKVSVQMADINYLFEKYGYPDFMKIDVEGYEEKIIKSIKEASRIRALSFEFAVPETRNETLEILKHLNTIGFKYFNISFGESMEFLSRYNSDINSVGNLIKALPPLSWGDVYAFRREQV